MHKTLDYKQLTNCITVHNPYNALPLHLQFSLSGYTKTAPKPTPINGVLSISRQYFDTKGNPITPDQLHVGDMIIVMLDVSADRVINDALVVDMLPAGLELENPNLVNNCINLQAMPELAELLKEQHSNDIKYQEFRDDRYIAAIAIHNRTTENRYSKKLIYLASAVSVGQYRVPAPYVESMYSTQWYAIGDSIPLMTINPKKE
ncbi:alpha-2-macroglobulin family protein [Orbus mooreae]|uniref:alpha-2-macroglobulin family protein n=1 Tax=Orbus mooreae TaxID=3074107 RepID=UPI00370D76DB